MVRDASAKGASIIFTPTISIVDPLFDPSQAYARFKMLSMSREGVLALTRPLSASLGEVGELLAAAGSSKRVLSLAARSLKDAHELIERFAASVDAVEFDVNLSCLLANKDLTYVIELARELAATINVPLAIKLSAASTGLVSLSKIAEAGASALVLTPNLVYKVGRHFFRLHSPHISLTLLLGVAEELATVDLTLGCVTQVAQDALAAIAPLRLFDITYTLSWLAYEGTSRSVSIPLSWRQISRKLRVYASQGACYCPYGLISGEGFVEGCNYCGMCLELNEAGRVELASLITP